ncbi:DUF2334 domain-containing protein [Pseudarthrobacter enclensis]|uniref:Tat pathway signal protein n=1 Tax=Pseudarthrobacter enclensis TaxID=993070 RepID=A0A0V8IVI5_9MICC|nr:DUF2334 domain-containing protein [Pseudarthrobacter enclensis]KSU78711.1 hypothetical protein AS031_01290 [Pseudarthrobacter enclensis]
MGWVIALVSLPLVAAGVVSGLIDASPVEGENSPLAQRYTTVTASGNNVAEGKTATFSSRFGRPGGARTLVLYDGSGTAPEDAELHGIAAGNLATHFGEAEVAVLGDYTADEMEDFDAVIYLGKDSAATPPEAFRVDVLEGTVPVLWVGQNIDDLVGSKPDSIAGFVSRYGWNPTAPLMVSNDQVKSVSYKNRSVRRSTLNADTVYSPRIVDPGKVRTLATLVCGEPESPRACDIDGEPSMPRLAWAVTSGHLTYLAEVPLQDIDQNDLYLIFSDLYYDLLAPGTEPVRQAALRLEDVGPETDPGDLRRVADYLRDAGVPFQVAVMPVYVARTPDGDGWYGLSLLDAPKVVEALKYMQARGGTLIQHGTTHQYGTLDNPYSGKTGEDYEFFRYGCTATERPPYEFGECKADSYITKIGPVAEDSVEQHVVRIEHGRQVMIEAGLGEPTIFETPHYTASVNAHAAIAAVYKARYEQSDYYAGMLSGKKITPTSYYSQYFPYTVHDIYGTTVYPENLGNITQTEQNNHAIRDPNYIIDRAEANLVVRESTASFFFHPYMNLDLLKQTVAGIKDLGYTFVPVGDLR